MLKKIKKDKNLRRVFLKNEVKKVILKSLVQNKNLNKIISWNAGYIFLTLRNVYKTQFVNRCIFTGRNSKISKYYTVSRLSFLKFARFSLIPGIFKSPE